MMGHEEKERKNNPGVYSHVGWSLGWYIPRWDKVVIRIEPAISDVSGKIEEKEPMV